MATAKTTGFTRTVRFDLEKETKGTVRYAEVAEGDAVIGSLYVRKDALGASRPAQLSVTVTEVSA